MNKLACKQSDSECDLCLCYQFLTMFYVSVESW